MCKLVISPIILAHRVGGQYDQQTQQHCTTDLITDQTQRDLAHGGAERQVGVIFDKDQAILSMILPDLCGELIAHRGAMRADNELPYPLHRNHAEEIANARAACACAGNTGGYNV